MKICILSRPLHEAVGGAEKQVYLISKFLIEHGHKIFNLYFSKEFHLRVNDRNDFIYIGLPFLCHGSGVSDLLGFVNMLTFSYALMRIVDADLYFLRGASYITSVASYCCIIKKKPFVFNFASLWDITSPQTILSPLENALYWKGLERASAVIAPTREIKNFAEEKLKRTVIHIPSAIEFKTNTTCKDEPPFALWIGRLVWYKNPLDFIKLAKNLPEFKFLIAGYGPLSGIVKDFSKKLPNLEYLGFVDPKQAEEIIGRSSVVVNTSFIEGFPNTLLEAANQGTPYVALYYDPDRVISKYKIGFYASGKFEKLEYAVKTILDDPKLRDKLGENARNYIKKNHDIHIIGKQYLELFSNLINKNK
jgi:glycosyltransferase involved in cell wall biosynthesis